MTPKDSAGTITAGNVDCIRNYISNKSPFGFDHHIIVIVKKPC